MKPSDPSDSITEPTPASQLSAPFEAWAAQARKLGRLRRSSSEEYYRAVWSVFTRWCLSQPRPVALRSITAEDLCACIASRKGYIDTTGELTPQHAWRMLNLVDRVLKQQSELAGTPRNMAAIQAMAELPGVLQANETASSRIPSHLAADEARALVAFIASIRPRAGEGADRPEPLGRIWQDVRDRAAVGLQLGAGLTPGDIRALTTGAVTMSGGRTPDTTWKLRIPASGDAPERETPVAPWAGQVLKYWLEIRKNLQVPGPWLFPATRSTGKPWGKKAQYNAAQDVLADAGINANDGGSFRLRHTFAIRQLRRGRPPEEVARWMGIVKIETMQRYERILHRPVDIE